MPSDITSVDLTADDVEILEEDTPFRGYFRMDRYKLRHRLFAGGWSLPIMREVFERGHAVAVVLYDPDLDRLVLVEQFRIGALAAQRSPLYDDTSSPWLLEIMAGIIGKGETAEAVARREAVEEAGCEITEIVPIFRYLVSPGGTTESVSLFCGRVDASNAGGVHGLADEGEDIRVLTATPEEVYAWLDEGRFINAMTLLGLIWFRAHHAELRARWRSTDGS